MPDTALQANQNSDLARTAEAVALDDLAADPGAAVLALRDAGEAAAHGVVE